jgi:hypothetical protein
MSRLDGADQLHGIRDQEADFQRAFAVRVLVAVRIVISFG